MKAVGTFSTNAVGTMNMVKALLIAGCLATPMAALAECERPKKPGIPDGAKASMEEMVTAQKGVKGYMAETNAFISCLEGEEKNAEKNPISDEEEAAKVHAARVEEHNSAVTDMETVAADFNVALKGYREANADKGDE